MLGPYSSVRFSRSRCALYTTMSRVMTTPTATVMIKISSRLRPECRTMFLRAIRPTLIRLLKRLKIFISRRYSLQPARPLDRRPCPDRLWGPRIQDHHSGPALGPLPPAQPPPPADSRNNHLLRPSTCLDPSACSTRHRPTGCRQCGRRLSDTVHRRPSPPPDVRKELRRPTEAEYPLRHETLPLVGKTNHVVIQKGVQGERYPFPILTDFLLRQRGHAHL